MDFFGWTRQAFWRGLTTAPPVISANWKQVVFGILVFAMNEANNIRRHGLPTTKKVWISDIASSAGVVIVAWIGLAVLNSWYLVYEDHKSNTEVTQSFAKKLHDTVEERDQWKAKASAPVPVSRQPKVNSITVSDKTNTDPQLRSDFTLPAEISSLDAKIRRLRAQLSDASSEDVKKNTNAQFKRELGEELRRVIQRLDLLDLADHEALELSASTNDIYPLQEMDRLATPHLTELASAALELSRTDFPPGSSELRMETQTAFRDLQRLDVQRRTGKIKPQDGSTVVYRHLVIILPMLEKAGYERREAHYPELEGPQQLEGPQLWDNIKYLREEVLPTLK